MQGDLISKSELLESLNDWIDENTDVNTILRWIEEYKIAYSVEKVIEQLEDRTDMAKNFFTTSKVIHINTAKKYVRNGGKE